MDPSRKQKPNTKNHIIININNNNNKNDNDNNNKYYERRSVATTNTTMEMTDNNHSSSSRRSGSDKHGRRCCSPSACRPRRWFGGATKLRRLLVPILLVSFRRDRFVSTVFVVSAAAAAIDAETGGECVDSDPVNCPFWAATGECEKNRGYMHVRCKKSCDRCNVVRVQNRAEIDRFMSAKQTEIAEKRKILALEKEALTALKAGDDGGGGGGGGEIGLAIGGGGDGGSETATTATTATKKKTTANSVAVGSDGTIESGGGDGTSAATAATTTTTTTTTNAVEEHPKPLTIKKKKAKTDAETGLECVDLDAECPFWAATGDCKTNRNFMSRNCRLSCDRCHIVRVNSQAEMQEFIQQKTREAEHQRAARKQAKQVQKILSGGEL